MFSICDSLDIVKIVMFSYGDCSHAGSSGRKVETKKRNKIVRWEMGLDGRRGDDTADWGFGRIRS
jgi:hypothetical protein